MKYVGNPNPTAFYEYCIADVPVDRPRELPFECLYPPERRQGSSGELLRDATFTRCAFFRQHTSVL